MTVSERLREFALAEAQVPEAAEAVLRLSLIDWTAVGIAGAAEPVAGVMRALAGAEGGVPQATLFGGGAGADPNGGTGQWHDFPRAGL